MKNSLTFSPLFYRIILLVALVSPGCSSLPQRVDPPSLSAAHLKMKFARGAQKQQNFARALRLYREAYDLFTRGDQLEGKINAALSIARQYFYLDNPGESEKWLNRAGEWIEVNLPRLMGAKVILLMEMAFEKNDYKRVIEISAGVSTPRPEWQLEILCYTLVAKARLKLDYQEEFSRVRADSVRLQKGFAKRRLDDPGVLSFAYYYTGYIYSLENNWQSALLSFEQAKKIDGLIDNPYGVGKDLYSLGQCYERLGLLKQAASNYERSAEVFRLLSDAAAAEKAEKKAASLKNQE
jgi:tetratricopeptide (TPR) repeat protein